jgi:hypothetical protein
VAVNGKERWKEYQILFYKLTWTEKVTHPDKYDAVEQD